MLKSLSCCLLGMTLLFACMSCGNSGSSGSVVYSEGSFEVIQRGGNPLLHQPPNLQLWYAPKSGKRSLVWSYLVAGGDGPEFVCDDLAVFNAGLSDDRRWNGAPALLAYSPGGVPVEITEMVTEKYCLEQKIEYAPLAGAFYYLIERSSKDPSEAPSDGVIQVTGTKRSNFMEESAHVSLSRDEVDQWIREIRKSGIKKSYDGVDYMIPESSAETAK